MSNEIPQAQSKTRGRPAGSNSFIRIRLSDLAAQMGENCVVPVSKVWLRENGIATGETLTPVILAAAPAPVVEQPKIEFSITTFDEENSDEDEKDVDPPVGV